MTILRSIWAVVVGILVNVVFSTGTDTILEKAGIFPPFGEGIFATRLLALALSYRLAYTVLGGYVTARLAPDRPMRHVIILASIGVVLGIIGIFVGWDKSEHWYPIALAITAFPATWWGGNIRVRRGNL